MPSPPTPPVSAEQLLQQLGAAIDQAQRPIQEIEVGIALSIALGQQRPAVACGGCSTPLEYRGIPARTNARLTSPFLLIFREERVVRS